MEKIDFKDISQFKKKDYYLHTDIKVYYPNKRNVYGLQDLLFLSQVGVQESHITLILSCWGEDSLIDLEASFVQWDWIWHRNFM